MKMTLGHHIAAKNAKIAAMAASSAAARAIVGLSKETGVWNA